MLYLCGEIVEHHPLDHLLELLLPPSLPVAFCILVSILCYKKWSPASSRSW